jgi:hypothetical protein
MVFAAVGSFLYNLLNFFHIIGVILGAGAAFVAPVMAVQARKSGSTTSTFDSAAAMVMAPGLFAAGLFGGAMVGASDDAFGFDQAWLSVGSLVWILSVAAAVLAYPPSYVKLPDMSDKKPAFTGILHLSLAVMLILMVWKPGT